MTKRRRVAFFLMTASRARRKHNIAMPKALMQLQLQPAGTVDAVAGIIHGCRIAEVNTTAQFADEDGKATKIDITPALIGKLKSLAEDRKTVPAFWTHDRLQDENDRDPLNWSIGVWSNFREDDSGNLIADLELEDGTPYRERALWFATKHPDQAMVSAVFDYKPLKGNKADPISLESCDLVKQGAATSALLAKLKQHSAKQIKTAKLMTLDDEDKQWILDQIKEAHSAAAESTETETATDDTAPNPAMMKAITGAINKSLGLKEGEDFDTKLKAAMTKQLGNGPLRQSFGGHGDDLPFTVRLAKHISTGAKPGTAILRAKSDSEKGEFEAWDKAGRPMPKTATA